MSIRINIPSRWNEHVNGKNSIEMEFNEELQVNNLLQKLIKQFPDLKAMLYKDNGDLRESVNFLINGNNIKFIENTASKLKDNDEVEILMLIQGG